MKLAYSTEQQELRESVRRFLADRVPLPRRARADGVRPTALDEKVWSYAGSQLGLQGIAIPEQYGGAGFTFAEQAIVLEELGAALYAGPYLASAVLAATALLASADEAAKQRPAARHRQRRDDRDAGLHRGERLVGARRDPARRQRAAPTAGGSTGTRASCSTGTPRA